MIRFKGPCERIHWPQHAIENTRYQETTSKTANVWRNIKFDVLILSLWSTMIVIIFPKYPKIQNEPLIHTFTIKLYKLRFLLPGLASVVSVSTVDKFKPFSDVVRELSILISQYISEFCHAFLDEAYKVEVDMKQRYVTTYIRLNEGAGKCFFTYLT